MKRLIAFFLVVIVLSIGSTNAKAFGDIFGGLTSLFSAEDDVTYGVGEKAATDDVSATLINVMESSGNKNNKPAKGNVFLLCEFKIENKTSEPLIVSTIMCFSASCDDTTRELSMDALAVAMMSSKYQLDRGIEPGDKATGVVGYEVPKDWKSLKVAYSPSIMSGDKLTFVVNR